MFHTLEVVPQLLNALFSSLSFPFVFHFGTFLLSYLQVHRDLPQPRLVHPWASGRYSPFLLLCFWFLAFPLDHFLHFPFVSKHHLFVPVCCLLFLLRVLNLWIIVTSNSLSHHSKLSVIPESGLDPCFVSSGCVFPCPLACLVIFFLKAQASYMG